MTCSHCGGTFYPESVDQIATHQTIRYGLLRESERWHMTEALARDLASRAAEVLPGVHDTVGVTAIHGIPRCAGDSFA